MAKRTSQFVCRTCGAVHPKWMGKCPDCGAWDALEEYRVPESGMPHAGAKAAGGMAAARAMSANAPQAMAIHDITEDASLAGYRLGTGIDELDRVLGGIPMDEDVPSPGSRAAPGANRAASKETKPPVDNRGRGFVPGSVVLIGGDPGVGKSTLMLQAADRLARQDRKVLYVSSEESAHQLRLRAERLGVRTDEGCPLYVLADTNLSRIVEQTHKLGPDVVVIDSVQMVYHSEVASPPGSVSQLKTCCQELVHMAKTTGCVVVLVGHVTKEGTLAGPRLLEHMVDTVLYFEGDRYHSHRIVRAIKNRFGTTLEVGLFEMTDKGLTEVADGSSMLAAEYQPRAGSVVCPVLQGTRCLLVEVQALTSTGFLGSAKRKTAGLDSNRLAMLIAVLEKHGGLRLADQDIFVSVVGGMKVVEPAADLSIALAIAGTHYNRSLNPGDNSRGICAVGEVGLGGELRHVQQMGLRLREAARLGFSHIAAPPSAAKPPAGCKVIEVKHLDQALALLD